MPHNMLDICNVLDIIILNGMIGVVVRADVRRTWGCVAGYMEVPPGPTCARKVPKKGVSVYSDLSKYFGEKIM